MITPSAGGRSRVIGTTWDRAVRFCLLQHPLGPDQTPLELHMVAPYAKWILHLRRQWLSDVLLPTGQDRLFQIQIRATFDGEGDRK